MLYNIFAHREAVSRALVTGDGLPGLVRRLCASSLACALLYGVVLGAQVGGWQVAASPVKLPLVMVGTAGLCVPALYLILAVAGARVGWMQVVGLALAVVGASGVAMVALLPVAAFWTYCAGVDRGVTALVHSAAFTVAGAVGSCFGLELAAPLLGERRRLLALRAWIALYGLVAQQMAWTFRPHFHATSTFMRPLGSGGSALENLLQLLAGLFR